MDILYTFYKFYIIKHIVKTENIDNLFRKYPIFELIQMKNVIIF